MEEINIKDLFEFFLSKLRIIVLVTLVVTLIGAIYSMFFLKPLYESTTTLVLTGTASAIGVSENQKEDGAITQNDLNLNSKLVATYREIIKSKTVLKDVINTLGLDYSTGALKGKINVSTVSNTEMISITVKSSKAEEAPVIANALAEKFSEQIKKIYNIENIAVIDKAEVQPNPVNVNITKQIVMYALIGLVLGLAIIFALFYFDTSLKDAKQIEKLGLTVLTSIPEKMEEGGRK